MAFSNCVVEMGGRRWVVLSVDSLCWFYPVILVLTKKTLCMCAEIVLVRDASQYREGRNCTGKPVSEFGYYWEVLQFYPDDLLQSNVRMFKFLGHLIQPLMG